MTTPKALSPEALESFLVTVERFAGPLPTLRAHIGALEADNAALLGALRYWGPGLADVVRNGAGADLGWMDERKAAEMLAVITQPHPGAVLLERHEKEIVRARNEGLEKARHRIVTMAEHAVPETSTYLVLLRVADEFTAMKEPES